jgi:putative restriction endonuclease
VERDEDVRTACFLALDVLRAQFGEELPYKAGLDRGFAFRGRRVPFLNLQKGIYRAAAQRGPAALSIQTSAKTPYDDEAIEDGFLYAYRAGSIDQPDNRALRAAAALQAPIVYFVATRAGWYEPLYPYYVVEDRPAERRVLVAVGRRIGPIEELEPVPITDPIERRYAAREVKIRLHQRRFRWLVIPAYREQCAICRLKEVRLLDAAHIVGDPEPTGTPDIPNGLSLCSIHHRAFDQDLVGIAPDYVVHVASRLLEDDDGPMLDLLKGFQGTTIELPRRSAWQPDRERLAERFERFTG